MLINPGVARPSLLAESHRFSARNQRESVSPGWHGLVWDTVRLRDLHGSGLRSLDVLLDLPNLPESSVRSAEWRWTFLTSNSDRSTRLRRRRPDVASTLYGSHVVHFGRAHRRLVIDNIRHL